MTRRLEGRVAVVTGGGNGIGRACCLRFAEEGADVVVADLLDEGAEAVAAEVKERGGEALTVHLDATSPESNEDMARAATERFGQVDALVTCAGITHGGYVSTDRSTTSGVVAEAAASFGDPAQALRNLNIESWQKVLDVNLTGTLLAVRAIGPGMVERGSGSVITIASIAAKRPDAGTLAYSVSKAGVWMLTKSLSATLAPHGVRVNAIGPGFIATNMTSFLDDLPGIKDMLLTQIPMGRVGKPEEIAGVASFLAGDESSYVSGEILHADGGFYTE
jgi:NAD(P)-dependent dehydrogenase (short-subunit alcohol dehydrogenase family)